MKFTQYFLRNRSRPDRQGIQVEWIERVIQNPAHETIQTDGRVRMWGRSRKPKVGVVLLEDRETVHNAFFDRRFQEDQDAS